MYSAVLAPRIAHLPRHWKLALAYLLTDEAFAAISQRESAGEAGSQRHWFYLGAGLALWGGWQLSTAVGVMLGARLPAHWSLVSPVADFYRHRCAVDPKLAMLATAAVSGGVALLAAGFPFKLGLPWRRWPE